MSPVQLYQKMKYLLRSNADTFLKALLYTVFIAVILIFGQTIFIPLAYALFISFVLFPICSWLEKKGLRRMLAISVSLLLLLLIVSLFVIVIIRQMNDFRSELPQIQERLTISINKFSGWLSSALNLSANTQATMLENIVSASSSQVIPFLKQSILSTSAILVFIVLTVVYSFLILFYRNRYAEVLYFLFPTEGKESIKQILRDSIITYYNFIKGMIIVYIIVGILNSIGFYFVGIPQPILFGMLASILTFIPYVGIIIGGLMPFSLAWIMHDSVWYPMGVIAVLSIVQFLEANVIFPFAVSNRLQVNTLVMLLAIIAGGVIWGVSGMILFVPFAGILKLIAERHEKMKFLSVLMGTSSHLSPAEHLESAGRFVQKPAEGIE